MKLALLDILEIQMRICVYLAKAIVKLVLTQLILVIPVTRAVNFSFCTSNSAWKVVLLRSVFCKTRNVFLVMEVVKLVQERLLFAKVVLAICFMILSIRSVPNNASLKLRFTTIIPANATVVLKTVQNVLAM